MAQQPLPNILGVHALVRAGDTSPASVDDAIAKTKETGYDLLELSLHDTANLDVTAARRQLTSTAPISPVPSTARSESTTIRSPTSAGAMS